MNKKILLLLTMLIVGISSFSNAATLPIDFDHTDRLDWQIVETGCIGEGCGSNSLDKIELTDSNIIDVIRSRITCQECEDDFNQNYKKLLAAYTSFDSIPSFSFSCEFHSEYVDASKYFEKVSVNNNEFYIYTDIFAKLDIPSEGRTFFSSANSNELYLIHFYPENLDLYYEISKGIVSEIYGTQKYGIYPLFNDAKYSESNVSDTTNQVLPNQGAERLSSETFLVCTNHSKCKECGSNFVASNGSMHSETSSDIMLSKYCAQEHACGFFWIIDNGGEGIQATEGVDCTESRMEDSVFCSRHTCQTQGCSNAVIGKNMADARSSISAFKGKDNDYYSYYCVKHFCHEYNCAGERINSYKDDPIYDKDGVGSYIDFPDYCINHCSDCSIAGCNNTVYEQAWSNGNHLKICKNHYLSFDDTLKGNVNECENCHSIMLPEKMTKISSDVYICFDCLKNKDQNLKNIYKELNISDEGYSYCKNCKSTVHLIKVNGVWYCASCSSSLNTSNNSKITEVSKSWGSSSSSNSTYNSSSSSDYTDDSTYDGTSYSSNGKYINYKQTRESWSNIKYSQGTIGTSGCGPTSIAICASGLGINKNPGQVVGNNRNLYASVSSNGILLKKIGLKQTKVSKAKALAHLATGQPVIVHAKPGYYTNYGHFMALTGINGNEVYLSNPGSRSSSKNGWININTLVNRNIDKFFIISKI